MGSPFSAVMASLYMKILAEDHYNNRIMGNNVKWWKYVDDVLAALSNSVNINDKLEILNNLSQDIKFTKKEEQDHRLPFLDTVT